MENRAIEGISMRETFASFLLDLGDSNLRDYSVKDLLEKEVLRIMCKEGFSQEQVYEMPLEKLLDVFYDAYLWNADRILSKAPIIDVHLKQKHLG